MNPLRWAMLVLCLDFAAALGMAAWLFTRQGYPDVVYYERLRITTSMAPPGTAESAELWVDPVRNVERRVSGSWPERVTFYVRPGGATVSVGSDGLSTSETLTPGEWASFVYDNGALRRGGFHALAASRFAHEQGAVTRVVLKGRPALRFETTQHDDSVDRLTVWLDARTHDPLQLQVLSSGYSFTQVTISTRRIPAGSLPAGFFDPPQQHHSPWDTLITWVHDRLMPGR